MPEDSQKPTHESEPTPGDQLSRLITGYFASQAIHVAAELRLADLLADGPRSVEELADATGTHPRSLCRLMRALASLGVFAEGEDHRFSLTPMADLMRSDVPGSQRATARMMGGAFYRALGDLIGSIRTGEPAFERLSGQTYFEYLTGHPEEARTFDDAMTALNDRKTLAMLEVYDFAGIQVLADIGGGNGGTLARVLGRDPEMRGLLFDLPGVVERAGEAIEGAGLGGRCRVVGGDFLESVPGGANAYLLRHILHNWDDQRAVMILRNVRRAMGESGRLLVVERVIEPGNAPQFGKLMDLTMLVVHGGVERTEEEFQGLLEAGGFRLRRIVPTAVEVSVIEGEPV
ncbi:methyltransferase [Tautonia plasticadhaerens]|uniref:Multifunctional cyclase-dehydratase-3-O-methyl transferase TcmN n=1 Tax=Tautonia plasticadhaerens TaxID=2527974 RepID=A0A518H4C7_9BACT|nr:methyltransferase [Tautonia plasticadhaerens]QDV35692.1 Multifunctional cyclase-dehydratase-3-O-methyl transferase TcmN [Tautonia plasticadhaerens]